MRLKKIIIQGFKSFADRTALEFHPGITIIVGPNGCGKSNVADAFRWVLGEQSAKTLRGGKMQDVIFAGTERRHPVNSAEVTIVIDDADGQLPVDYREVAVTRRLHRNGESEYLINGHSVRLKDVQGLFYDSGIGKDSYALFEQGKIDEVINLSPLERRAIFEEAAGIVRFLVRKREALRKLEQTQQHLLPLEEIQATAAQRLAVLEEQAAVARGWREKKGRSELLTRQLMVSRWRHSQQQGAAAAQRSAALADELAQAERQQAALRDKQHAEKVTLHHCEEAWRHQSEALYAKRNARELSQRDRQHLQERVDQLDQRLLSGQEELSALSSAIGQLQEQLASAQAGRQRQGTACEGAAAALQRAKDTWAAQQEALELLRSQQLQRGRRRHESEQQLTAAEGDRRHRSLVVEGLRGRQAELEQRCQQQADRGLELQQRHGTLRQQLDELTQTIEHKGGLLQQCDGALVEVKEASAAAARSYEECRGARAEAVAQQRALTALQQAGEGMTAGTQRLLEEAGRPGSPLHGQLKPLWELLTPPPGHEEAVATVLQRYGSTLVALSGDAYRAARQLAMDECLSEVSLFDLSLALAVRPKKGSLAQACAAADQSLAGHFLGEVSVAATAPPYWDGATGWFCDGKGVLFSAVAGEKSAFVREAHIHELEKRAAALQSQLESVEARQALLLAQHEELQRQRSLLDREQRSAEMKHVEVNFALQRLLADQQTLAEEGRLAAGERAKIAAALAEEEERAQTLVQQIEQLQASLKTMAYAEEEQQQLIEETAHGVRRQQQAVAEAERAYQQERDAERQALHQLELWQHSLLERRSRQEKLTGELAAAAQQRSELLERQALQSGAVAGSAEEIALLERSCRDLEEKVKKGKEAVATLDDQWRAASEALLARRQQLEKGEQQRQQLAVLCQALEGEYREKYGSEVSIAPAAMALDGDAFKAAEKELQQLQRYLEGADDVNMMAIEEFEELKAQVSQRLGQIDDLKLSRDELQAIIAELEEISRSRFKETFAAVRANFRKNFAILFEGGEADLLFTDSKEALDAGIEIVARPPGKQMRSISLLSGGEKCLTAMALLFAIFEVRPAPYCILDEIDAPLDDSNIARFVNVVKTFVDRCQFIIITHNKRTMAIGDRLYGVTMQERGVSKLLSMQFTEERAFSATAEAALVES